VLDEVNADIIVASERAERPLQARRSSRSATSRTSSPRRCRRRSRCSAAFKASPKPHTTGSSTARARTCSTSTSRSPKASGDQRQGAAREHREARQLADGSRASRQGRRRGERHERVFFSLRKLKSDVDFLTAHQLQEGVTPFVREAGGGQSRPRSSGTAAILAVAHAVAPGSVEWDPRSSDFGKIKSATRGSM
jgi:hypothetical protein